MNFGALFLVDSEYSDWLSWDDGVRYVPLHSEDGWSVEYRLELLGCDTLAAAAPVANYEFIC